MQDGFTNGFDIGYRGPSQRQSLSNNIPFTEGVGDKFDLWAKIMKEVKLKRMAGPYKCPPFNNFIQSPVGLVPKAGNKTRMIFHLSYNFGEGEPSVNGCTPDEMCSVQYRNLDYAIDTCLQLLKNRNIDVQSNAT